MRECILTEKFTPSIGFSEVVKSNKYGTFVGTVVADNEDYGTSRINAEDGIHLAHYKADIACAHERAKRMRERWNGAKGIVRALENVQLTTYEMGELWDKLLRQVRIAEKNYRDAYQDYLDLKCRYRYEVDFVQERRKLIAEQDEKLREY